MTQNCHSVTSRGAACHLSRYTLHQAWRLHQQLQRTFTPVSTCSNTQVCIGDVAILVLAKQCTALGLCNLILRSCHVVSTSVMLHRKIANSHVNGGLFVVVTVLNGIKIQSKSKYST